MEKERERIHLRQWFVHGSIMLWVHVKATGKHCNLRQCSNLAQRLQASPKCVNLGSGVWNPGIIFWNAKAPAHLQDVVDLGPHLQHLRHHQALRHAPGRAVKAHPAQHGWLAMLLFLLLRDVPCRAGCTQGTQVKEAHSHMRGARLQAGPAHFGRYIAKAVHLLGRVRRAEKEGYIALQHCEVWQSTMGLNCMRMSTTHDTSEQRCLL
eukprot:387095-Pelagomonas_calceolata.AAC.1